MRSDRTLHAKFKSEDTVLLCRVVTETVCHFDLKNVYRHKAYIWDVVGSARFCILAMPGA